MLGLKKLLKGFIMDREYDWDKLKGVLEQAEKEGNLVTAGTKEDWFWTANELTHDAINAKEIAGIDYSAWDIPGYVINDGEFIECWIERKSDGVL